MSVSAQQFVRDWVNNPGTGLIGTPPATPGPLSAGAFLNLTQRSPADGAYAVLTRQSSAGRMLAAEPGSPAVSTVNAQIYGGTRESAEAAAGAYADAVLTQLTGNPVRQGAVTCLVADNVTDPGYVPQPADSGELFCFQVTADFLLAGP